MLKGLNMKISQLAAATGVAVETIRYYEQQNLLPPPARLDNGYRAYNDKHVEQLAFIKHCRSLDMSIADTAQCIARELFHHVENTSAFIFITHKEKLKKILLCFGKLDVGKSKT